MCTCREIALSTQREDLLAEEVPRASSSTWRRLFRGMKSSKLPRQVDSIRAESSSNGSWRCHRALPESLRTRAFYEVHSSVAPTLRAFRLLMLLLSYFIFLRLATPALRLGVIAGSWLRSEAYVLPYWSAAFVLVSLVLLFLAVHRYG